MRTSITRFCRVKKVFLELSMSFGCADLMTFEIFNFFSESLYFAEKCEVATFSDLARAQYSEALASVRRNDMTTCQEHHPPR